MRLKWSQAEDQKDAKRAMLTEAVVARSFRAEARRAAFEASWREHLKRSQGQLHEGTFMGPIVPIGFEPEGSRAKQVGRGEVAAAATEVFLDLGSVELLDC